MAIVRRAMSVCVRLVTRGYSALSQFVRKGVILTMGSAPNQDSAAARQGGRGKTAQNASQSQAVNMDLVQNHMSVNVKKVLKEIFVINQTVAMAAMKQMDIVRNQESASAKWAFKASVVTSVCRTQAA